MTYFHTLSNHVFVSRIFWYILFFFTLVGWYFKFDADFFKISSYILIPLLIPAILLHIEYVIIGKSLVVSITEEEITVVKNGLKKEYVKSDISNITLYKSGNADSFALRFTAFDVYNFIKINFKNGDSLIITCFLCKDLVGLLTQNKLLFNRKRFILCSPTFCDIFDFSKV